MRYWPTEEKEALRALIAENLTGEVIAQRMSDQFNRVVTRSAVCGQIGRMGLKNGRPPGPRPKPKVKPKVKAEPSPAVPMVAQNHAAGEPSIKMRPCTIFQLKEGRCRFPLWPDHLRARPDYLFCGAKAGTSPYCEHHERVVYNRSNQLPSVSLTTMNVPVKPL